jgi:hypothetical protein
MNTTTADQAAITGTHLESAVTSSHRDAATRSRRRFTARLVADIHSGRRIAAVVIAGCAIGVAGAVTVAAEQKPSHTVEVDPERAALVRWAEDNDLIGLSPASVRRQATPEYGQVAVERAQIAAWAHTQGLSGLSPASMQPAGD